MNNHLLKLTTLSLLFFFFAAPVLAQYPNQRDPMTWFVQGANYAGQGDYNSALQAFDQAIQIKPDFAEAWLLKAVTLAAIGRKDEALRCVERAFQLAPEFRDPRIIEYLRILGVIPGAPQQRTPGLVNPFVLPRGGF